MKIVNKMFCSFALVTFSNLAELTDNEIDLTLLTTFGFLIVHPKCNFVMMEGGRIVTSRKW